MTDEIAKELAYAMRQLATALNALPRGLGGINVQHNGQLQTGPGYNGAGNNLPSQQQWQFNR